MDSIFYLNVENFLEKKSTIVFEKKNVLRNTHIYRDMVSKRLSNELSNVKNYKNDDDTKNEDNNNNNDNNDSNNNNNDSDVTIERSNNHLMVEDWMKLFKYNYKIEDDLDQRVSSIVFYFILCKCIYIYIQLLQGRHKRKLVDIVSVQYSYGYKNGDEGDINPAC